MIKATGSQLAKLQKQLPVETAFFPVGLMATLFRNGERGTVQAYYTAHEMATVQFCLYREILGLHFCPKAVANYARFYLTDYVKLFNFLEQHLISPILFLRSQTEVLRREFQPRGMSGEKALERYDKWVAREASKVYTPADAFLRMQKLDTVRPGNTLLVMLEEHKLACDYLRSTVERSGGMSFKAVLFLEAWHLPGAFLLANEEAVQMADRGTLEEGATKRLKDAAHALIREGCLEQFLDRVKGQGAL